VAGTTEKPVDFLNGPQALRGTLHLPDSEGDKRVGIIFLHGWSGSRIGPHSMFVHAARNMSRLGYTCLRFDFRGRGDSDGETATASIASMIEDAGTATEHLLRLAALDSIIHLGICSGGKIAIGAAAADPRIGGLVLWSAEALGPLRSKTEAQRKSFHAARQYASKLLRAETWRKLLAGQVRTDMVRKALVNQEAPDDEEIRNEAVILDNFRTYDGSIHFVYGTHDPDTRNAADKYLSFCRRNDIPAEFHAIEGANHSFYSLAWEAEVLELTESWLLRAFPGSPKE
jgi:pimeloyl-ACP methyl ester carboxylesterase